MQRMDPDEEERKRVPKLTTDTITKESKLESR